MPTVCSPYKIMTGEVADCQRMCCLRLRFNLSDPALTYAAAKHQGRLFWITCKQLKLLRKARESLTSDSKFSALCCSATSMWHPNNQNWFKPFSKLAAVLNNLKTVASSGTTLSGNWRIGASCDTGHYEASPLFNRGAPFSLGFCGGSSKSLQATLYNFSTFPLGILSVFSQFRVYVDCNSSAYLADSVVTGGSLKLIRFF